MPLPIGLVYDPANHVVLDPDAGVSQAVRHLFATFARTGSARAVVQTFAAEGLRFPLRVRKGPHKGELAWGDLRHWRVLSVLHNPRYAGAFFYGRHRWGPGPNGKGTMLSVPRGQWIALIPDAHPGYITWETFEANQRQLLNSAQARGAQRKAGPAREGPALLQGLAVCGRCGRHMTVGYHTRRGVEYPEYRCTADAIQAGTRRCQIIAGAGVDEAVSALLLDTLTPLALEVALSVQAEIEARAGEADRLRRTHVERAQTHAEMARRRYLGVDPGNRLVADALEADWNDALRCLREAQDDYDRASAAAEAALSDERKAKVRALAGDFPALWADPATPQRERKRMIRLLVEDVTLHRSDVIHAQVRFRGGQSASLSVPIPPKAWETWQTPPDTVALIDSLLDDHTDAGVAEALNQAGHRSGKGQAFSPHMVEELRRRYELRNHYERLRAAGMLSIEEMALRLGVHAGTIKVWRRAGVLTGHLGDDKNRWLFEAPTPGDPRLVKRKGSKLAGRCAPTGGEDERVQNDGDLE